METDQKRSIIFLRMFVHPLNVAISDSQNKYQYVVCKHTISVFAGEKLVGYWVDTDQRDSHNSYKKLKSNAGDAKPKGSQGIGAPPVYSYIRNLRLTSDEGKLIACVDSDKSVVIFKIDTSAEDPEKFLQVMKRQQFPKRPNALALADEDTTIIVADKFGDVYNLKIDEEPIRKIDDQSEPILGHVSMLTDVAVAKDANNKSYIITTDRDEHIKISHYPQTFIVDKWLFGHKEFVSSVDLPKWQTKFLFSAGGDKEIFAWNWQSGELLSQYSFEDAVKPFINDQHLAPARFQNEENNVIEYAVASIKSCGQQPYVAFFVEATPVLFILHCNTETGELSLAQQVEFKHNVVSISSNGKSEYLVTFDNRDENAEQLIAFLTYSGDSNKPFSVDENLNKLNSSWISTFKQKDELLADADSVYPLYNIASLKKHGEHFS